jgi:hypothetical protein
MTGSMRLFSRTHAKVSFAGQEREWPVLWIDDERFSLGARCAAQGATLDATLTFAETYRMTIPVRAEIPTRAGQTFQVLDMPDTLAHTFRRLLGADYSHIGV